MAIEFTVIDKPAISKIPHRSKYTALRLGRGKAQCAPNPNYPNGVKLDCSSPNLPHCDVDLPYPAPECGLWLVVCSQCRQSVAITAAGRTDDPISVKMTCRNRN